MRWADQDRSGSSEYQDFMVPAMFTPFAPLIVQAAGVAPGSRVLDLACGTGAVSREAARVAGVDGAVIGVDLGEPMLAVARAQPAEPGAAPIAYRQGVAGALPLDDASVDALVCHHGFQFFDDRPRALREMIRVLVPGGRLAIATWGAPECHPHFEALGNALERHLGPEMAAVIRAPYVLGDPDGLGALLRDAGLDDVAVALVQRPTVFASAADFARRVIAAGPLAERFAAAPAAQREAVGAEVAAAMASRTTPDGQLASSMTALFACRTPS